MTPQQKTIVKYFNNHVWLRSMTCIYTLGITKPSTRIGELEAMGYTFDRGWHRKSRKYKLVGRPSERKRVA